MRFERITDAGHPMYAQALELYRASFPPHEQREARSQEAILSDTAYFFNLLYDKDTFVGLLLCWETERFIYVEHLCVLPEMRNRHYGRQCLALVQQKGKHVILEIDPPVDAISIRRKGFYERSGFVENAYPHLHPPYHSGNPGHALVVLSFPSRITAEDYAQFSDYLKNHVMEHAYS